MSHYFKNDPKLTSEERIYNVDLFGHNFKFMSDKGVFSKDHLDVGSYALISHLDVPEETKTLLDVGAGIGVIGIILKKVYPSLEVTQIDINQRALALNKKNNQLNNVETKVFASDLFSNIQTTFDMIVTNPPIRTGKETIYKLYQDAYKHLNKQGTLWIVVRKDQGAQSTIKYLNTMFDAVEIVKRHKGFYVIKSLKH